MKKRKLNFNQITCHTAKKWSIYNQPASNIEEVTVNIVWRYNFWTIYQQLSSVSTPCICYFPFNYSTKDIGDGWNRRRKYIRLHFDPWETSLWTLFMWAWYNQYIILIYTYMVMEPSELECMKQDASINLRRITLSIRLTLVWPYLCYRPQNAWLRLSTYLHIACMRHWGAQ